MTAGIQDIKAPWSIDVKRVSEQLHVKDDYGLSSDESLKRLQIFGYNKIESKRDVSPFVIFSKQFISPFAFLLVIAAVVSFLFKEWLDGAAILAVVIINAIIGFWMEFQAERSMTTLKKLVAVPARVVRDRKLIEVSSEEVVPGDLLFVDAGDMVAADALITKSAQLQTDESTLTGESLPIEKKRSILPKTVVLAERTNMLYKGTHVTRGNGYALVTHTGMNTELGAIAKMIQHAEQAATPLEKKIKSFSKKLIWITIALIIIIFIAGILNGHELVQMLETSIALAVAAIPEGLPIVATLALALGMLRMAKRKVIVKKLSSVETLGGTTVICTDKTGTLTQNKIEAAFACVDGMQSNISFDTKTRSIIWQDNPQLKNNKAFGEIKKIAALCNNAIYDVGGEKEKTNGDPLEIGLLKMVYHSGSELEEYKKCYQKVDEIPFTSETKLMATLHRNNNYFVAAKGAVEELLFYCNNVHGTTGIRPLNENEKQLWLHFAEEKAKEGLRILAFAYKQMDNRQDDILNDLTLAGLIGFIDPPRKEVAAAIEECRNAGIKVVMVTGDHPATARNIAQQLGLANAENAVIHGNEMKSYMQLTDADKEMWMNATVFARVTPVQKLDLVTLYQEKNMIVGMTGDGVNDAPALKKSDIGIAMGEHGTQVAQEVADMVLKNDSFSSIAIAIKQGRVIFDNIRKFVIFLLSCNLSELFIVSLTAVLNLHFQLFPLQILYINLVTDVLPALALGITEAAPQIMKRKPYPSNTPVIDSKHWVSIFTYSLIITITTIAAVLTSHIWLHKGENWNAGLCNNVLFYTLIVSQILHVFNMSFEKHLSFFKSEVFRNKYVWYSIASCVGLTIMSYLIPVFRRVLGVSVYGWKDWSIIIAFSFLSIFVIQFFKKRWVL